MHCLNQRHGSHLFRHKILVLNYGTLSKWQSVDTRVSDAPPRTDGGDRAGGGCVSVNRRSSHLSNRCLQLTLMLLKVRYTSVMLREGSTPSGSNLGSSSVMVAPRPTGPRSRTVTPNGSSQQLRCCETGVIHHDAESLKTDLWPTSRDLSIGTLGSLGSPR